MYTSTGPYTTSLEPDAMIQAVVDASMSTHIPRFRGAGSQICGPPPGLRLHARLPYAVYDIRETNVQVRPMGIYQKEPVAPTLLHKANSSFVA